MPHLWPTLSISLCVLASASPAQPVERDVVFYGRLDNNYMNPYNWKPTPRGVNTEITVFNVSLQANAYINPGRHIAVQSLIGETHSLTVYSRSLLVSDELSLSRISGDDGSTLELLNAGPLVIEDVFASRGSSIRSLASEIFGRTNEPEIRADSGSTVEFPNVTRISVNIDPEAVPKSYLMPRISTSGDDLSIGTLSFPVLTEWPDGLEISIGGNGRVELDSATTIDGINLELRAGEGYTVELFAPGITDFGGLDLFVAGSGTGFVTPAATSGFVIDCYGKLSLPELQRITQGTLDITLSSRNTWSATTALLPKLNHFPGDTGRLIVFARGFSDGNVVYALFESMTTIPPNSTFAAVGNDTHFDLPNVTVAESVQFNDGTGNNQTTLGPLTSINNSTLRLGTFGDISHPLTSIQADRSNTSMSYRNSISLTLPNLSTIQPGAGTVTLSSGGDLLLPSLESILATGERGASLIAGGSLIAPNLTSIQFFDSASGSYVTGGISLAAGNGGTIQIGPVSSLHSSSISLGQGVSWDALQLESLTDCTLTLAEGAQLLAPTLREITGGDIDINGSTALLDQLESITDCTLTLADGAQLLAPELRTVSGGKFDVSSTTIFPAQFESITDTDIVVRGPDEGSGEPPFSFGSGISPVFQEVTIWNFGEVEFGYTTLRGSVTLYRGPSLPHIQRIETEPVPGLYPSITIINDNNERRDFDLSSLEELPPGVQIWTMYDVTIGGDVRSNLLMGRHGTYYIEGDVIPEPMIHILKNPIEFRDIRLALVGEGTQRFEVFTGRISSNGWLQTAQLMIGDGLRSLDVMMSNDVINRVNPNVDTLQLRPFLTVIPEINRPALEIQPGARLILNGTEVLLDENYDNTYITLESLIPPGQNCIEYDRGLLCRELCLSDSNRDGIIDNADIQIMLTLYLAGDLAADFNEDGLLDSGDLAAFIDAFIVGC